jgi:pimeloyl-ACP methyl ester carboxylesterase
MRGPRPLLPPSAPPFADRYFDAESSFTTLEGMQVHTSRRGRGPTIVLVHGSGASLHIFEAITERLAASFDVLRRDLPGFGITGPRRDRDYRIATYVSFLHRFLSEHVEEDLILAGHSLGGQIAWSYALDHPRHLTGLVLMNATGYPEKTVPLPLRMARTPLLRSVLRRWGSRTATARNLAAAVGAGSTAVDDAMIDRVRRFRKHRSARPLRRHPGDPHADARAPQRPRRRAALRARHRG